MCWLMPTGLPVLVINEVDFREAQEHRLAIAHFIFRLDAAADDLLGWDAINLLRPRPHELDAAAGDDKGFKAVRAQVGHQLDHGLINAFGIRPLEFRMLRGGHPIFHDLLELLSGHAGMCDHHDFKHRVFAARERALQVALEQRGKGLLVLPFRMLRSQHLHPVEREEELKIHRLLGPERAVVIERGDAGFGCDVFQTGLVRGRAHELDNRLLSGPVIPRRQGILSACFSGQRNKNAQGED